MTKKQKVFIAALGLTLIATARCGKDSGGGGAPATTQAAPAPTATPATFGSQNFDYFAQPTYGSYFYFDGTCSTGFHDYKTLGEMCDQLKNNELNKNCAQPKRYMVFTYYCYGRTW